MTLSSLADHLALGVPDPGSLSELRRELSEVGGLTVVLKGFVSASFPDTYDTNYDQYHTTNKGRKTVDHMMRVIYRVEARVA